MANLLRNVGEVIYVVRVPSQDSFEHARGDIRVGIVEVFDHDVGITDRVDTRDTLDLQVCAHYEEDNAAEGEGVDVRRQLVTAAMCDYVLRE